MSASKPIPYRQEDMLKRQSLGRSSFSSGHSVTVPSNVVRNYNLHKGDVLEWYPGTIDFPDEEFPNIMAIIIKRQPKAKG